MSDPRRPELAAPSSLFCRPAELPGPLRDRVVGCRFEPEAPFLTPEGALDWPRLAALCLAPPEHAVFDRLDGARRRDEWLMGRIAAKDAVRLLCQARRIDARAAEIEIGADAWGRPVASGAGLERSGLSVSVSLAHTFGVAMAIAATPPCGLGVDLERVTRPRGAFERRAFSPAELALLGPPTSDHYLERRLRLWCAKEAAAKALGRGLMGSPRNLEVRTASPALDEVRLVVRGALAREFPGDVEIPLTASAWRDGALIVAAALLERTA